MVFRRRTDQIYATLQQAQRRITQGHKPGAVGGESAPSASSTIGSSQRRLLSGDSEPSGGYIVRPDGSREEARNPVRSNSTQAARRAADVRSRQQTDRVARLTPALPQVDSSVVREAERHSEPSGPAASGAVAAVRHGEQARRGGPGMRLSPELASVVAIAWLASVAVAYLIGSSQSVAGSSRQLTDTPSGVVLESDENPAASQDATWIVIVDSVPAGSEAAQRPIYQKWQQDLNAYFSQLGFREYFGIRVPQSGGLQFIYGAVGGRLGVTRGEADRMCRELTTPRAHPGTGEMVTPAPSAYIRDLRALDP